MNEKQLDDDLKATLERLLKPADVAHVLDISVSLAYRMLNNGTIPTVRFGGSVRVRACDLELFIQHSWSGWRQE